MKAHNERFWKVMDDHERCSQSEKDVWESKRRQHMIGQKTIKEDIRCTLRRNPHSSWRHIEKETDHWCCDGTMRHWAMSHKTCETHDEQIAPLLSEEQKLKHLQFSKCFLNNWGVGPGEHLSIHCNEKWFWGMVAQHDAKSCEELGFSPRAFKACHKSHTNEVMAVAVMGFAFEDSMENGGDALKIGVHRAQSHKVHCKDQQATVMVDGVCEQQGELVCCKGEMCMVDCAVTGSSTGSHDDPKLSLKSLFEESVFPEVA